VYLFLAGGGERRYIGRMTVTPADFKQTLGRFLSGVTVVSVEVDGEVHGMTASAFLSVSLDPPLVLVSVARTARMHALLAAASRFGVTLLSSAQQDLSNHFAGYGAAMPVWDRSVAPPVLANGLGWLSCVTHAAHEAGDHTLYLGRVEALGYGDGEPLAYYRGKYRGLVPV